MSLAPFQQGKNGGEIKNSGKNKVVQFVNS